MRSLATLWLTLLLTLLLPSRDQVDGPSVEWDPTVPLVERIPARPLRASTGSDFAAETRNLSGRDRQRLARKELVSGNLPGFLRQLKSVELTRRDGLPLPVVITIWVMPDYLAVGCDEDFLRIPLDLPTATSVAAEFGFVLPTTRIVDAIYEQSDWHLSPQPMRPGPKMRSSDYYLRHQRLIEDQRSGRPLGELVSGHKKDLVITERLRKRTKRVAIYGWHRSTDDPIQPLSTVHGAHYTDYSHGVRLISRTVLVGDRPSDIVDVLADPTLAPALTDEGSTYEFIRLMSPVAVSLSAPVSHSP